MTATISGRAQCAWLACLGLAIALPCTAASDSLGARPPSTSEHALVAALSDPAQRAALRPAATAEADLRQDAQLALWPADIARLCADYVRLFPQYPWAHEAAVLRHQAAASAALLRRGDVQLFRTAFTAVPDGGPSADDLRRAALGDKAAALRLADQALPRLDGARRQLGWLQYAAVLGSEEAAYALALHYRRDEQPILAAKYEARAIEMGYVPPLSLDHRRN